MDKLNWANYTFDDFTLFCNALLEFELGKGFQPFSASGKDGGIDGAFNGSYMNIEGLWRFQYKFRLGPRIEGFRNIKSLIKSELAKLNNENVFVLLTNVELLPQELSELQNALTEELSNLDKTCRCVIWDGAKLYNLYLQHPILELWLLDGFYSAQLQDYRHVFKKSLEKTDFSPGTLSNIFVSRTGDLNMLKSFLQSDKHLALVTGEAGIGKTRLIIEFFKTIVDVLNDWSALVLLNRNVEFDKLRKSLAGQRNYIIFIDDAHTYSPEVISDMKALCEDSSNKVKMIITSRNLEAFKSLSLIKEYEKAEILHIELDNLSRADAEMIFMNYVKEKGYAEYVPQLVEISYGKPILIVAILNAIQNNIAIGKIREQGFVKEYVSNYFQSIFSKVRETIGWSIFKTKRILQYVVLIEPFNYNDNAVIQKIADIHDVKSAEVTVALNLLINYNFVDGRYIQCIKPDYYSDIILSEIDHSEVSSNIGEFIPFLDNIIINLSSVDEVANDRSNVLEDIIKSYATSIAGATNVDLVNRVLTTVYKIAGYKPEIVKQTVELYLKAIVDPKHVIYTEIQENRKSPSYFSSSSLQKVIEMLSFLLSYPTNYDFVFRKSFRLFELTKEINLIHIYSFDRQDVRNNLTLKPQHYFIQQLAKKLGSMTINELTFGINVLKSFLNLEFTYTGVNATQRNSINITTYYLPANASVKKMRQNIADTLKKLYTIPIAVSLKLQILKTLLDIPRSILSTQRNSKPYRNDEENTIVLNFLEEQATQFDIFEKKEVHDKLYWYGRWGIASNFISQMDIIKARMQPKNLTERLSQIFSKVETSEIELTNMNAHIDVRCDDLVAAYSSSEMVSSIIEFLEPLPYAPPYFYRFIDRLVIQHFEYAKGLYKEMFRISPKLFNNYAATILGGLYYISHDNNFYWEQVKTLQKLDSIDSDNILLSVYGSRIPGGTTINQMDCKVILKIFNKKRKENNYNLASGIQSLIVAKHPKASQVCVDFLKRADQKEAEMFFIWISDNKAAGQDLINDLVLNHTKKFYLSYEIERCLNSALINCGVSAVFKYLCSRFEYKRQEVINKKTLMDFEFLPDGESSRLFEKCPPEYKGEMFMLALEWYMGLDGEGLNLFYAKNMIEYLKPSNSVDSDCAKWYINKIRNIKETAKGLNRILETLSIFHVKDDILLDIIIEAYTIGYELIDSNPEMHKLIRQGCYEAITTLGVKSGTPGEPFQVDIELQNLLKVKIDVLPEYLPAAQFLKDVLKSVEADINRSVNRGNFTW